MSFFNSAQPVLQQPRGSAASAWGVGEHCLLGWKCVLFVLWSALWLCRFRCALPDTWVSPFCPSLGDISLLQSRQLSKSLLENRTLCNGFNRAYATYVLKWFVINHHDFLQDVLSPGLSVLLENKTQSQEYIFFACLCFCGDDSGKNYLLFFLKICVFFLLITSDKWNTICKITIYSQASVHCVLIFLKDRLKLRRNKS